MKNFSDWGWRSCSSPCGKGKSWFFALPTVFDCSANREHPLGSTIQPSFHSSNRPKELVNARTPLHQSPMQRSKYSGILAKILSIFALYFEVLHRCVSNSQPSAIVNTPYEYMVSLTVPQHQLRRVQKSGQTAKIAKFPKIFFTHPTDHPTTTRLAPPSHFSLEII